MMFHFFKKKDHSDSDEKKQVFGNFVRGVWLALQEMDELDPDDWTQLQNVANLCVLAWNCSQMETSPDEAKATVPAKLHRFFHCDDSNVANFVCQTMDFKYQNFSEQKFLVLESQVVQNSCNRKIDVILDNE